MKPHFFFCLFIIPISLINSSTNSFVVNGHCLTHQLSLLLHLKNNFIFNHTKSSKLVHWNQSDEDCCHWHGVSCRDGHVSALDLSHESISGGLNHSSDLFKLRYLESLNLAFNNFHSVIPQELHQLQNLRYLNLSNAGFEGQVPKDIFKIHTLEVIDISDNQYLHGSLPDFPPLASLHYLNLAYTNFSGPIPNTVSNLKNLSTIDLSYCQFNGTLPSSMSQLTQLFHLDMSSNNLTGPLPSFNKSKNLTYLSLFHNHLSGDLPSGHFEGLKNLVSIDLGFNSFKGNVPSSLLNLPCLREIKLPFNQLDGHLDELDSASTPVLEMLDLDSNNLQGNIPASVFNLRTLRVIQLSANRFNGTIHLDVIRKLNNLSTIGLSHNNLSVVDNFKEDHDLSPFPEIRVVMLASCKLKRFPSFLKNRSTLLTLDLSRNEIQGQIPTWIWRLESLITLNLSKNSLTNFEESIWNLNSNLYEVDLSFNQLQGPVSCIPKYVTYLDYSSNRLSSIIPSDIGNYLPFIQILFLSNNSFTGKIHESFCNSSTLRLLDLSYNKFDGTIPKCFAKLSSSLRMLNFGVNKLRGHIPDTIFRNSCALRYLDLNDNLLEGTIPGSLANCTKLQVLNLGNNALIDRFPCFLSNISTLRIMVLRSNKLHGSIGCPNSNGEWEMLHIVDLSSNNFSGMIPGTLLNNWKAMMRDEGILGPESGHLFFEITDDYDPMSLKAVLPHFNKYLSTKLVKLVGNMSRSILDQGFVDSNTVDLQRYQDSIIIVNKGNQMKLSKIEMAFTEVDMSNNYFKGPIPDELMEFKALHALNLSHNALTGHIPSSVGNLKNLESMDLSNNFFNGEIPQELSSLSFIGYLNLSFNRLEGQIPLTTQIQTFNADSFEGNEGLCGPPLTNNCSEEGGQGLPQSDSQNESSIDWNFLSVELGVIFGFGVFILPLICWKKWRLWYSKHVDGILYRMIPQLDFEYEQHEGKRYRVLRWRY